MRLRSVAISSAFSICTILSMQAQDDAFVRLDAQGKSIVCVTRGPVCPVSAFRVQGQQNELRVVNRKFLTNYVFFIDNITPIVDYPIEDLNEAANLSLTTLMPAAAQSKGAAPKGLSSVSSFSLRTAQDILTELLNPGGTSNVANELESDFQIVRHDEEKGHAHHQHFTSVWNSVNGIAVPVPDCNTALSAPTLEGAQSCLTLFNQREVTPPFLGAGALASEDAFRNLIVIDNDAIAMTNAVQRVNDYYLGSNVQITRGVQVIGGFNGDRQTALDPNYSLTGVYKGTPTFSGGQGWTTGGFVGIGLNLSIFRKAFAESNTGQVERKLAYLTAS